MKTLIKFADNRVGNSFGIKLRRKRFTLFKTLSTVPRPLRILDVGGTQLFWEMMGFNHVSDVKIILFNLRKIEVSYPNFKSIIGDARDMRQLRITSTILFFRIL